MPRGAWRYAWQFNQEIWSDRRRSIRAHMAVRTGEPDRVKRRDAIDALRVALKKSTDTRVKMAALVALGRAGGAGDADRIRTYLSSKNPSIRDAAFLAAALLDKLEPEAEKQLRRRLARKPVPPVAWIALGERGVETALATAGPDEPALAELFFAAGRVRSALIRKEIRTGALTGRYFARRLEDLERAYAARALGLYGDAAVPKVGASRTAGPRTRRGAAFGMYRRAAWDKHYEFARLVKHAKDPWVKAWAALGAGMAGKQADLMMLMRTYDEFVDFRSPLAVKPFLAMGVALGARRRSDWPFLKKWLYRQARDCKDRDLSVCLHACLGLAQVEQGIPLLRAALKDHRRDEGERAWAAQALGMLAKTTPKVKQDLRAVLRGKQKDGPALEQAAIALARLGQRDVVRDAVQRTVAGDEKMRARWAYLLGIIGGPEAMARLVAILDDDRDPALVRAMAATALGLCLDPRQVDPLAALKAEFDYTSATRAIYELLQVR